MKNDWLEEIEDKKIEQKQVLTCVTVILLLFLLIVLVNFRFTSVEVFGNESYTDDEVREMILPGSWDRNPCVAFVKHKLLKHKSYPFVSSYSLDFTGPVSCEIILYEKQPVGYLQYMDSFMYFDKDGIIIESDSRRKDGIPEITGLRFGEIVTGKKLDVGDATLYDEILNISSQLKVFAIPCVRMHFDSRREVTLYVDSGDIRVLLGDDAYLNTKLSVLSDVIGEMRDRGMKGVADLSNYNDRDSAGFSFVPD